MRKCFFILGLAIFLSTNTMAGHLLGGEMYYECTAPGQYTVTMVLYRDCATSNSLTWFDSMNGAQYKATITVYRGSSQQPFIDSITLGPPEVTPIPAGNVTFCTDVPKRCVEKATYTFDVVLPVTDEVYYLVYQRCCRNNATDNILEPDAGTTIKTEITPESQSVCASGLKFRNFPPRLLCVDEPLNFDHSVEDLDPAVRGRIEYSLCEPLMGGDRTSAGGLAPNPDAPPPYNSLPFVGGNFTVSNPFGSDPAMSINAQNGMISVTPQFTGRFVVAVCATKYDENNNVLFSIKRDYEYRIVDCVRKVSASIESDTTENGVYLIRVCGDSTLQLENNSTQENFIRSYNWYFDINGDKVEYIDREPIVSFPGKGVYDGLLVLNESGRCPDTARLQVDVLGKVSAEMSYDYDTCNAGPVSFESSASSENGSILTRQWILDGQDTLMGANVDFTFRDPGNKTIQFRSVDEEGCESILTREIPYFPIPNEILVDLRYSSNCTPAKVIFENNSYPLDDSYQVEWRISDVLTSQLISPEIVFEEAGIYPVHLTIVSPIGCIYKGILEDTLSILESPEAAFRILPESLNQFTNEVSIVDRSSFASQWEYRMSTGAFSVQQEPVFNIPDTGSYSIEQFVTHENGCKDTTQLFFDVPLEALYFLPNAFTPDQDGRNDLYIGTGDFSSFNNFQMSIFNRWGEQVFQTYDPAVGWNGSKNNKGLILPNDVYTVLVSYINLEGKTVSFTRFATLIR